ncbi:hypothetical protein HMPREF3036_02598 [Sutterella sp. KLE1602]|nr:hypothetical protein HMPREF3036_02598 [Sutterella sp. KLE1602]
MHSFTVRLLRPLRQARRLLLRNKKASRSREAFSCRECSKSCSISWRA